MQKPSENVIMSKKETTPIQEGKTEAPQAVNNTSVNTDRIQTHGKTEPPQAVIQPTSPAKPAAPSKPTGKTESPGSE